MGNTPDRIRTGNPYMMRSVPVHTYHYNAMRKKEGYSMVGGNSRSRENVLVS